MGSNQLQLQNLLDSLLSGSITDPEKEKLREYIRSSYKDKELDSLMHHHWQNLGEESGINEQADLHGLKIRLLSLIEEEAKSREDTVRKLRKPWIGYLSRAAAILFIPLLIASVYFFFNMKKELSDQQAVMQEVIASPGARVHFTLPDKSEVWLNSASKLEFPLGLNQNKQRIVKLTGQGYFKVAPDKKRPFLVETNDLKFKVLGTAFDVSGYVDDNFVSSTLEEGSIAVLNMRGKELVRLQPQQQANLDKNSQQLVVVDVETKLTTSWKDGRLIFKNTPLNQVINQMERWFNCNIQVAPEILESDIQFSATIQDETLGEVLQMIEISSSVNTKNENRKVTIWAK